MEKERGEGKIYTARLAMARKALNTGNWAALYKTMPLHIIHETVSHLESIFT